MKRGKNKEGKGRKGERWRERGKDKEGERKNDGKRG